VNAFAMEHEPIPLLEIDETVARQQVARLRKVRKSRNQAAAKSSLADLKKAARDDRNLMPFLLKSVKAYATLGEIMDALKDVYGEYQEPVTF
jgi:methylmalonyl-CoA mutase N-terminal domain/subunit